MGMLDYLQENWRDIYRPFQRYPEIYGEHAKQGMGMLKEDAPGAWDVATKPLGALMMSGIPSLYEAFRDEPIRNTLISDLGIDPKKADYATQAIGLGMDVGVPYAVIRKGLTPWISEQVAKQANPTGFSPSRRRFLKGSAAAAAGTATGIPMLKQVAKTVPDAFGSLMGQMSSHLGSVGVTDSVAMGMEGFRRRFGNLTKQLTKIRGHRKGMISDHRLREGLSNRIKQREGYEKDYPVGDLKKVGDYYTGNDKELTAVRNSIRDQVNREQKEFVDRIGVSPPGYPRKTLYHPDFRSVNNSFGDVEKAKAHYKADPEGFTLSLEDMVKKLREMESERAPWQTFGGGRPELIADLEDFLKELKAQ